MPVAIKRNDGGMSIMRMARGADVNTAIKKWQDVHPGEYVSHSEVGTVPGDQTFRLAWTVKGKNVVVDIDKAREVAKDHIRARRAPMFIPLDVAYLRADEAGDAERKKSIVQRKAVLRDATAHPAIAAAKTADDLKAAIEAALQG